MRRRTLLALLVTLAAMPLAACQGGGDDDAFTLVVRGRAQVTGPGPVERLAAGSHDLLPGQTVRVTEGTALLELPGDGSLELRAAGKARRGADDSIVRVAARPTLVDGDALVLADDENVPLSAGGAALVVRNGAARVWRSTGVTLGVYDGTADVRALGRSLPGPVVALRQVAISDSGTLPRRATPLVYDRDEPDPWDVRFLGDAIDLGEQLDRRSLALTSELRPTEPPNAGFLTSVVPALRSVDGFQDGLVDPDRTVGETVVGASIALGGPGSFVRRWTAAFTFREQGADWGLVAMDQRARRDALFGVLDGVLDAVPSFAVIRPVAVTGSPGTSSTTTTTTAPPTTEPPPPGPPGPNDVLDELVEDLLEDEGGNDSPDPPPEDETPPLGDLLDAVEALLFPAGVVQPMDETAP